MENKIVTVTRKRIGNKILTITVTKDRPVEKALIENRVAPENKAVNPVTTMAKPGLTKITEAPVVKKPAAKKKTTRKKAKKKTAKKNTPGKKTSKKSTAKRKSAK